MSLMTKAVGENIESKYSTAAQRATEEFLNRSGLAFQVDSIEEYATRTTIQKTRKFVGEGVSAVAGSAAYIARCVRNQRVVTRVSNPIINQKHTVSLSVNGIEISDIRSFEGISHWVRFNRSEYVTGVNVGINF